MTAIEQIAVPPAQFEAAHANLLSGWDKIGLLINSPDCLLLVGLLGFGYVLRKCDRISNGQIPAILFVTGGICGYFLFMGRTQWQIALGQGFAEAVLVVGFNSSAKNTLEGPVGTSLKAIPIVGPAIVILLSTLTGADANYKPPPPTPA